MTASLVCVDNYPSQIRAACATRISRRPAFPSHPESPRLRPPRHLLSKHFAAAGHCWPTPAASDLDPERAVATNPLSLLATASQALRGDRRADVSQSSSVDAPRDAPSRKHVAPLHQMLREPWSSLSITFSSSEFTSTVARHVPSPEYSARIADRTGAPLYAHPIAPSKKSAHRGSIARAMAREVLERPVPRESILRSGIWPSIAFPLPSRDPNEGQTRWPIWATRRVIYLMCDPCGRSTKLNTDRLSAVYGAEFR